MRFVNKILAAILDGVQCADYPTTMRFVNIIILS